MRLLLSVTALLLLNCVADRPAVAAAGEESAVRMLDVTKMNILFIDIEDCNPDALGCYGNPICKTPHLDQLAKSGVRFDKAYVQGVCCNPSRTSFLTGLRPLTTHVTSNGDVMSQRLPPGTLTLPEMLKAKGFYLADIGKLFHEVNFAERQMSVFDRIEMYGKPKGWQGPPPILTFPAVTKGNAVPPAPPDRTSKEWRQWHMHQSDRYGDSGRAPEEEYDYRVAQTAVALLATFAKTKRQFFLPVTQSRPHTPLICPKKYLDLYDAEKIPLPPAPPEKLVRFPYAKRASGPNPDIFMQRQPTPKQAREAIAAYYACVSFVDDNVGMILDALEHEGLAGSTMVVFLGDHGFHLGDHGCWSKYSMLEATRRGTLIVRVPGAPANGKVCREIVEFVDLVPTLGELVQLDLPKNLEGLSFVPLLANVDRPWKKAMFLVGEEKVDAGQVVRTKKYSYLEFPKGPIPAALYDLEKDPWEMINVADDPAYAAARKEMAELLHAGWKAALPPGVQVGQRAPDAREPVRIENRHLDVKLEPNGGAIQVADRRTGRVWQQMPFDDKVVCCSARAEGDGTMVAQLRDVANGLDFSARIALSADRPEMSITLHGDGPLRGYVRYPQPFVTDQGTALVVPTNEGILYPVDDPTITPLRLTAHGGHGGISMPWFGVMNQQSGAGVMGILATPDDASIEIARLPDSGLLVRPAWEASWQRFSYDRKIIYVFFDQGGYVAQAKRYREYAREQGLVKTLAQKKAENPNVDLLVGAVNVWNWDMDKLALCREMKSLGMDHVLWSNGGGPREIREINRMGYLTSRYENLGDLWPTGTPVHLRQEGWPDDLVRLPNGEMHKGWLDWEIQKDGTKKSYQAGVSNAECVLKRVRARVPEELKTRPLTCRFEDTTTATWFWEDYSPAHPATRSVDRRWKMALLDYFSNELKLVVGSETGLDAAVPYVHYFEGMLSLVRYRLPEAGRDMVQYKAPTPDFLKFQVGHFYRVPLFELVYHDCVVSHWYWGDYNNKVPEVWDRRDLLNILYGTPPMFMFDKDGWEKHKGRFTQCYKNVCPVTREVGYDEMLSHEFLSADHAVQRTQFSSCVQIVVNLGDTEYHLPDGRVIRPMEWLVSRERPCCSGSPACSRWP